LFFLNAIIMRTLLQVLCYGLAAVNANSTSAEEIASQFLQSVSSTSPPPSSVAQDVIKAAVSGEGQNYTAKR
jgi:hypothetical protein